jgi:prepilin-type N-terminal cleavage/methylation domain-containing protein/prepilin-type processing-associated H-X9-DG protein
MPPCVRLSPRRAREARRRRGFTLIELLVVVAIIGMLVALLLPAVQAAREAARRLQCINNLKQMGLALHHYHEVHGVFPPGGYGGGLSSPVLWNNPTIVARRLSSWGSAILPYLEQAPLYHQINQSFWYVQPENTTAGGTVVQAYLCPSNPAASLFKPNGDNANSPPFARNDYAGNYGERALRCFPDRGCQNSYAEGGDASGRGVIMPQGTIVVSVREISDGTTNTIVLGEAPEALHGLWIGHKNFLDQSAPLNARYGRGASSPWQSCQAPNKSPNIGKLGCDFGQEFHSHHPGGANFLFADGSARFVKETLAPRTLAALLSRKGGEIVGAED